MTTLACDISRDAPLHYGTFALNMEDFYRSGTDNVFYNYSLSSFNASKTSVKTSLKHFN